MENIYKYFHINTPYYGAWSKYGWGRDDWGLGLCKERIDRYAKTNETIFVSYKEKKQLYTIKARKVQKYPVEKLWNRLEVYIIPKSSLNYKPTPKKLDTIEELAKAGVFG